MRYARYDTEERVEREAALSIPRPWRPAYFATFTAQLIWWLSITIYLEAGLPEYRNWQDNMVGVMRAMFPLTQAAIAYTVVAMELARHLMLLAPHFEVKIKARAERLAEGIAEGKFIGIVESKSVGLEEGKAMGKAAGIAEANREWLEWFANKATADAAGEPFDEPSPADREERKRKENGEA